MSVYIHKSHNVSVMIYHVVCCVKYRNESITDEVDKEMKKICMEIEERYDLHFLEIGTDVDHVHFLIQSIPMMSATRMVQSVKSIIGREIFRRRPEVKRDLWGGEFFGNGYFVSTVSKTVTESVITKYVKEQGYGKYRQIHKDQLKLI